MTSERQALILAKIAEEQAFEREWAYDLHVHQGIPFAVMLGMAMRPRDAGGVGRMLSWPDLRRLIDEQRAIQGTPFGDRETRIERRQMEIDELARAAKMSLARAGEAGALDVHAAKVLLEVRAAEAKMHGDDAAQRVDVEVTTRTQLDAEIEATLERLDQEEAASAARREDA